MHKGKKSQDDISIPKEVVIEMLCRVPGHDLSEKLKMVCMQWCSIIYSGRFAYSHIEQRKKSSSFSQLEAVVVSFHGNDQRSVRVSSLEWHGTYNKNHHHFQDWKAKDLCTANNVILGWTIQPPRMMRVNSVNGFVCFWNDSDQARYHVLNPVTKDYVITPPNPYLGTSITGEQGTPAAVGFGFCSLSYEYKVVVLDDSYRKDIKPSVFTIGTDHSWRPLKEIPYSDISETVVCVKGIIYWYAKVTCTPDRNSARKREKKTLICFDVTKEEFDVIVVPIEIPKHSVTSVAEKGGRLCLVTISRGPICSLLINVYVACNNTADDLSSLNSWKKEVTVAAPSIGYSLDLEEYVYAVSVTDEIVAILLDEDGSDYAFFDVVGGKLLGLFSTRQATLIPYMSSLVAFRHRLLLASSS
ncbi:hypothetical protein P3S67_008961 [Capsicum chacoense]